MRNWLSRQEQMVERYQRLAQCHGQLVKSASGSVVIMHGDFAAFDGDGPPSLYATLGLCTAGGGPTRKYGKDFHVSDDWAPGKLGLALPDDPASGSSPAMSMLGIAFKLDEIPACHGTQFDRDGLRSVANRLFADPLAEWMMTALWRDAEAHGASSAFFEHGLSLLLHRLSTLAETRTMHPRATSNGRLAAAITAIEENLDEDLRVRDLSRLAQLDPRSFTRLFRRETGHTPFAYLTIRRMERAKCLLRDGGSITEVATAVGYSNPAKFAAAFRRWIGANPSEWLQRLQS